MNKNATSLLLNFYDTFNDTNICVIFILSLSEVKTTLQTAYKRLLSENKFSVTQQLELLQEPFPATTKDATLLKSVVYCLRKKPDKRFENNRFVSPNFHEHLSWANLEIFCFFCLATSDSVANVRKIVNTLWGKSALWKVSIAFHQSKQCIKYYKLAALQD